MQSSSRNAGESPPALRALRSTDIDAVLAIERACYPTPWTAAHFRHEIESHPFASCWAAERDGKLVAYACTWIVDGALHINNIATDPAWRRRGYAARLLRAVLADAAARGCDRATLEVRPSNEPAKKLYERLGFRREGMRRGYYVDTAEDALLLGRELSEADCRRRDRTV